MFNIGGGELIVIALIALLVLGPARLPGAARKAGEVMGDLRRLSTGFQTEIRHALEDAEREAAKADAAPTAEPVLPTPEELPPLAEAASSEGGIAAAFASVSDQAAPTPAKKAPAKKAAARKAPATSAKAAAPKKAVAKKAAPAKRAPAKKRPAS